MPKSIAGEFMFEVNVESTVCGRLSIIPCRPSTSIPGSFCIVRERKRDAQGRAAQHTERKRVNMLGAFDNPSCPRALVERRRAPTAVGP